MTTSLERGHHFSWTLSCPNGHTSHSAIVAVVCDLPAACKLATLNPPGSHFYCSVCQCCHLSTLGWTDYTEWRLRNKEELHRRMLKWKHAPTSAAQVKIFKDHGVHWSEFWWLPYWDPVCQLIVDLMHCILKGLAQYQSHDILCLTMASASSKQEVLPTFLHHFMQVDDENCGTC